jgi:23S rRNA (uridine2552-2'-O)-methyltransferase
MHEHVTDPWVRRAKAEGWRSRAAFKLLQMDEKDRLLRPGMTVIDLGASPGGWSQVAARAVAPSGRVVAVDLLPMAPLAGVTFLQGDFEDEAMLVLVEGVLGNRPADLVLSDMAPNLSGVGVVDQARCERLAEAALDAVRRWLRPGGALLVKAFHGGAFDGLVRRLREDFDQVAVRKPQASRGRSAEIYLLARGWRGAAVSGTNQD